MPEDYIDPPPVDCMRQPTVGTPPSYTIDAEEVPWLLGTQLTEQCGPLARAPAGTRVLLIEAHDLQESSVRRR